MQTTRKTTKAMSKTLKLHTHQRLFLTAKEKFVGLFGGLGNGKTLAGCAKILELATTYPNNLCLVGRLTYPELRDSTREVFMNLLRMCYPETAYKFNTQENSVTLWNDSKVIFRHLDNPANLLSMNLGAFYIDQAEEVDEDAFKTLQGRLRRQNIPDLKGLVTGNPAGHNWVYERFGVGLWPAGSNDITHNLRYRMITAPTIANAANLPEDYEDILKQSYSPEWYARYVMGSWDAFEGQIFDITKVKSYDTLPGMAMILTAVDPAISEDKAACNTAIVTLGVGLDGFVYDIETIAGQWSFLSQIDQLRAVYQRHEPEYIGTEDVSYQRALYEASVKEFEKEPVQIVAMKADRDKFRRAKTITNIIDKGLFRTNNKQLLSEMSAFRADAKGKERKDRVDALVHALTLVQRYAPVIRPEDNKPKQILSVQQQHLKDFLKYKKDQYDRDHGETSDFKIRDTEIFNQSSFIGDDYF